MPLGQKGRGLKNKGGVNGSRDDSLQLPVLSSLIFSLLFCCFLSFPEWSVVAVVFSSPSWATVCPLQAFSHTFTSQVGSLFNLLESLTQENAK